MLYIGSKRRIGKELLNVMLKDVDTLSNITFIDLFCGGGNLVQYTPNTLKVIANDINKYTISFLQRIQKEDFSFIPTNKDEFTKEDYIYVRDNKDKFSNEYIGHVGYNLSFGGKFFGGFRHDNVGKRDYVKEAYNNVVKQGKLIKHVEFINKDYKDVEIKENSIVYCDIPYINTTKYVNVDNFDYEEFYNYCKQISKINNVKVYVSSYNMPEPFKVIWKKQIKMTLKVNDNSQEVEERLYTL